MSGDGLADLVLIHDSVVEYWPSLGRGRWGRRIRMRSSPKLPTGYRPDRLLLGDLDGDGLADLVYAAAGTVTVWFNRGGDAWSQPLSLAGVPEDNRTCGSPTSWVLALAVSCSAGTVSSAVPAERPCTSSTSLVAFGRGSTEVDDQMGALTRVAYASSAQLAVADAASPATRWRGYRCQSQWSRKWRRSTGSRAAS